MSRLDQHTFDINTNVLYSDEISVFNIIYHLLSVIIWLSTTCIYVILFTFICLNIIMYTFVVPSLMHLPCYIHLSVLCEVRINIIIVILIYTLLNPATAWNNSNAKGAGKYDIIISNIIYKDK